MKTNKKIILFYIFTFGIGYFIIKKNNTKKYNDISGTHKIDFDIKKLIIYLGGYDNIVNVTSTINNLKVELKNIDLINIDEIKKLNAIGTLKNNNCITILFGDNSQYIAKLLSNELKF